MKVIEDEDLVDQQLISELRKEYGMTYNDFFMVLTDTDMKVKVRVSTLSTQLSWKKMHWKHNWNWKKKKNLGNYITYLHVRPIRYWCRTWSLLENKQKSSKRIFQNLSSYLHFLHLEDLRNCVFLLEWWGTEPPHTWQVFIVVPGILKRTVWLLKRMTAHCIRTIL